MRQNALGAVTFTVGIDRQILECHQVQVDLLVVLMRHVIVNGEFAERFDLFLKLHVGSRQEGLEGGDLLLENEHFTSRLVFDDLEVQAILFEDLDRTLHFEAVEHLGHLSGLSSKDLEFSALQEVVELRNALDKVLEEDAACFNEFSIIVVLHLHICHVDSIGDLLRDGWNITTRPAFIERSGDSLELVEAPLAGPLSSAVASSHSILSDLANLDRIPDSESFFGHFNLIFVILAGAFHLCDLCVEVHDLLDQLRLRICSALG